MRRYRLRKRLTGMRQANTWVSSVPAVYSDHQRLEARSLAMHCLIARKISREPRLLDIARNNLAAWKRAREPGQRPRCLAEWDRVLHQPWPRIAAFMVSTSCVAARLRQSSPFAGVLDTEERRRVYDAFRT